MTARSALRAAVFAALVSPLAAQSTLACAFHTVLPEKSLTGQIIEATDMIAARPAPHDPFRYQTVAVLKGSGAGGDPPYIVDSLTRTRLARNPDEAVLFVKNADGIWARLLVLDAATRPVLRDIQRHATAWNADGDDLSLRAYFAPLLAASDPRIRKIALRELDTLPYTVLRGGQYPVESTRLLQDIAKIDEAPFAPIRILLLGLDGGARARAAIVDRLELMARLGIHTNLGAWLTADIESRGTVALSDFERAFLHGAGQLRERQRNEIANFLSLVRAEADPSLRPAVDATIRRFVAVEPSTAPLVVKAFGASGDYSQADLVGELVAARAFADIPELMSAVAYIQGAQGQNSQFQSAAARTGLRRGGMLSRTTTSPAATTQETTND